MAGTGELRGEDESGDIVGEEIELAEEEGPEKDVESKSEDSRSRRKDGMLVMKIWMIVPSLCLLVEWTGSGIAYTSGWNRTRMGIRNKENASRMMVVRNSTGLRSGFRDG